MHPAIFRIEAIALDFPCLITEQGKPIFNGQAACVFAGVSDRKHAARWIKSNVETKWIIQVTTPDNAGRSTFFLTLPGFFYILSRGNTLKATLFRREIFGALLPHVLVTEAEFSPQACGQLKTLRR